MGLSEKEWDEAKRFGQYLLKQGEDESEAVVEFRRQDLAAYLGMLGFCHKGGDDVQLDACKSAAAIAWGWLWHVTTTDDRVKAARHLLGQMLDKDLKRYGIQTAKADGGAQFRTVLGLTNEAQQEVASLPEASEAMQEAVAWLMERGYVEMAEDPSGQYVNVLRRPGEDDDEDMEP